MLNVGNRDGDARRNEIATLPPLRETRPREVITKSHPISLKLIKMLSNVAFLFYDTHLDYSSSLVYPATVIYQSACIGHSYNSTMRY